MSGQIDGPVVPPSAIVTLGHFVMVRILARQPVDAEKHTNDFENDQNLARPFLGHFLNFE